MTNKQTTTKQTTTSTVKCLIVGWGGVSQFMAQFFSPLAWFEVVGIVDPRNEALEKSRALLGLESDQVFSDFEQALNVTRPDAVIINTPSFLHYDQTVMALNAGAHVLVAKPITTDFDQAVRLVALAKEKKLTLSVGQQVRFSRHYTAVRRLIDSGQLGQIEAAWFMNSKPRPNPANLANMDQPALYEMACHHFDSLLHLFEPNEPQWISCDGFIPSWSPYAGPCMVNALVRFSNNLHLSYHGGFSSRASMYELRCEGDKGALQCHGIHMTNDTMNYEFAEALGPFKPQDVEQNTEPRDAWTVFFEVWRQYMVGGDEPAFSGQRNLKVLAMLTAAIESVETGKPVAIEDNPKFSAGFACQ